MLDGEVQVRVCGAGNVDLGARAGCGGGCFSHKTGIGNRSRYWPGILAYGW